MKQSVLLAALSCAVPMSAMAQEAAPVDPPCKAQANPAERASAALPARAATRPMPERGTVAPANRVPSHVDSASSRAMAAATARQQTEDAKKNVGSGCGPAAPPVGMGEGGKTE